jgi:SAM-dependent methyltransferase
MARALWISLHLIYGSFVGAYRARRGLGLPKSQSRWDAEYSNGSWKYLDGMPERSRQMVALGYILGLEGQRRVLDVGCGTAGFLELGKNFPLSGYHGIDISEVAISNARQRFRGTDIGFPVRFEVADFEAFTSESRYDVILFNESLSYARDPMAILQHCRGLLSPDGVFLVSLCYNWWLSPLMERITRAYRTLHSSEVINEEGLTWQIRVLAVDGSSESVPLPVRPGIRRWAGLRSMLAESRVMILENIGAILLRGSVNGAGREMGRGSHQPNNEESKHHTPYRVRR